jgi:hypothetical protein
MDELKRTSEYRKMLPLIARAAGDVGVETQGQEIQALLQALNSHKTSADHDARYSLLAHLHDGRYSLLGHAHDDLYSLLGHIHDDRYFTEGEVSTLLSGKADKSVSVIAGWGLAGGGDLSADMTLDVGAGTGIKVQNNAVGVDLSANFSWSGSHTFGGALYSGTILPSLADVYDLGGYNKPWRKIWGSELSAVIFAQHEQTLMGGWLTISKGEGKLPSAVAAANTQIALGSNNFATGDIIVFRGISSNGSPQVEYMSVGTLIIVTTYNVTRNLDGTGANDWPEGTVYANWGKLGNGRIELNAEDTPRLSVYAHGDTLAAINEQIRIGDLNGNWGYSTSVYGAAFGEYAVGKPNLLIEPGILRLRNYDQDVIKLTGTDATFEQEITFGENGGIIAANGDLRIDSTGIRIKSLNALLENNCYRIVDTGSDIPVMTLQSYTDNNQHITFNRIWTQSPSYEKAWLDIAAHNTGENTSRILLHSFNETNYQTTFDISSGNNIVGAGGFGFQFMSNDMDGNRIGLYKNKLQVGGITRTSYEEFNLDFRRSIGTCDYDTRLQFSGGNGTNGNGSMSVLSVMAINTLANPTYGLIVKSKGATSATAALLLKNSAGTDLFSVNSVGDVWVKNILTTTSPVLNGTTSIAGIKPVSGASIANNYGAYMHLGGWGIGRTDPTAVLVNTAYMADTADTLDGYHAASFGRPVFLTTQLSSASWNGNAYSTTGKTLIDLSAVFGAPAGIKAVLLFVWVRDSGSAGADTYLILGPSNGNFTGMAANPHPVNDRVTRSSMVVPCDANGDIYYQIGASGAGTFDVTIQIWGYWL